MKSNEFAKPHAKVNSKVIEKVVGTRGLIGISTKYEENVFDNGHSTVWGSYWHPVLGWGYRCCYSFDKKSKCKGEEGKIETIKREYEIEMQAKREKEEAER